MLYYVSPHKFVSTFTKCVFWKQKTANPLPVPFFLISPLFPPSPPKLASEDFSLLPFSSPCYTLSSLN